jgi:CRP/FNR family transcriptional regulator, cyclic AMP receptor protein
VKIQLDREDGTDITLALLGPGDTVGEMSLVEREGRSANVVTLEDTTFLWMDRASFLDCLQSMTQLTYNLVRQLSSRLRLANQKIQALSTLDVAGRVARQVLIFADQYGRDDREGTRIPVPLTQSDIAEMVAATRERVNHVMVRLKKDGILSVERRRVVTVHKPDELAKLFAG